MKILISILFTLFLIGCKNNSEVQSKRTGTIDEYYSFRNEFIEKINDKNDSVKLFLNYRSGMTKNEFRKHSKKLVLDSILIQYNDSTFSVKLPLENRRENEIELTPIYYDQRLIGISLYDFSFADYSQLPELLTKNYGNPIATNFNHDSRYINGNTIYSKIDHSFWISNGLFLEYMQNETGLIFEKTIQYFALNYVKEKIMSNSYSEKTKLNELDKILGNKLDPQKKIDSIILEGL